MTIFSVSTCVFALVIAEINITGSAAFSWRIVARCAKSRSLLSAPTRSAVRPNASKKHIGKDKPPPIE
jgi:hypothetical protein